MLFLDYQSETFPKGREAIDHHSISSFGLSPCFEMNNRWLKDFFLITKRWKIKFFFCNFLSRDHVYDSKL